MASVTCCVLVHCLYQKKCIDISNSLATLLNARGRTTRAVLLFQWPFPVPAGCQRWGRLLRWCGEPRHVTPPPSNLFTSHGWQLWFRLWHHCIFSSWKFRSDWWSYRNSGRFRAKISGHSHSRRVRTRAGGRVPSPPSPSAPITHSRGRNLKYVTPSNSTPTYEPFPYYELSLHSSPGILPLRTAPRAVLYVTEVMDRSVTEKLKLPGRSGTQFQVEKKGHESPYDTFVLLNAHLNDKQHTM